MQTVFMYKKLRRKELNAVQQRIGVSYPLPGSALNRLAEEFDVVLRDPKQQNFAQWLEQYGPSFDGLITMLSDPLNAEAIAKCRQLKAVANYAVGYNNIDVAAAGAHGIQVMNTPDVLTETSADFAWALLMAAARRIAEGDVMTRAGEFTGWQPELLLGKDVFGSVLGIVGAGRIGQAVAARARGFSMTVLYHNRQRLPEALESQLGMEYVSLEQLLQQADFVSLHCPLTPETRHLISTEQLAMMKTDSILINTARGPVVDELAMLDALQKGVIAGAALDVYEWEPNITQGLRELSKVVLAPHAASASRATRETMAWMVTEDVAAVLAGKTPQNPVQ